jgi:hypothetical protein
VNKMGLKLLILSYWTPKSLVRKELTDVSNQTTMALKSLIDKHESRYTVNTETMIPKSIEQQRSIMAQTHAVLVQRLEATIGHEEAVVLGRKALFAVGEELGIRTRIRLGVGDNPKDLAKAAKILYRILGIDFHLEWLNNSKAIATVNRCALAQNYSNLTCEVLSAADEGVIKGLMPNVTMKFKEFMTSGCPKCTAEIHFERKERGK